MGGTALNAHPQPATDLDWTACTLLYPPVHAVLSLLPPLFFSLSRTEELAKAVICARDRRALQQLALDVHDKHSDLIDLIACRYTGPVVCNAASVTFQKIRYYGRQWDFILCYDTYNSLL